MEGFVNRLINPAGLLSSSSEVSLAPSQISSKSADPTSRHAKKKKTKLGVNERKIRLNHQGIPGRDEGPVIRRACLLHQ